MHTFLFGRYFTQRLFLLSLFSLFILTAPAQTFVPQILPGFFYDIEGLGYWADIDNDGDLDYLTDGSDTQTRCYLNEGGVFSPLSSSYLPFLDYSMPMGDFNQDGFLDFLSPMGGFYAQGDFDPFSAIIFPFDGCRLRNWFDTLQWCGEKASFSSNETDSNWGDDDNDGDVDMLYGSYTNQSCAALKLYRWDKGTLHETQTIFQQDTVRLISHLQWEDFDRDGDLDILVMDKNQPRLFINQQGWYEEMKTTLGDIYTNSIRWVDLDNDGDLDIVQAGHEHTGVYSHPNRPAGLKIYFYGKDGYSLYYSDYQPRERRVDYGHTEVGDIDNDGDVDILASVDSSYYLSYSVLNPLQIYRNQGGTFIPSSKLAVKDYLVDTYTLADYDRDGDLDITNGQEILANSFNSPPVLPSVPAGLGSSVSGKDVTLSWQASTDARYASDGLTYNVHIFSSVKGLNYLNGVSYLPTGQRSILRRGNASSLTHKTIKNMPDGTYSWMVQAIDPNYNASAYSAPQSFTIANGTVLTGSIVLGTLQWLNTCECNEMVMAVNPSGTFDTDNRFLLQLSDSTGSFASPTTLFDNYFGDQAGYHNGIKEGKISGWLPKTIPQGTHYRVRVISTYPARVSADNGYDIAIKKAPQLPGAIMASTKELCINSPDTQLKLSAPALYTNHYAWDIQPSGAGVITENGLEATVNWADEYSGPVQIRVKGINGCGDGPDSAPLELFIRPLPSPANSPRLPETICPGQTSVLVEVDSAAYAESYEWTLPPGASVSAGTANDQKAIRLDFASDFTGGTLSVVSKSICGMGQAGEALIEVLGRIAKAAPIEGPDTLCAGQRWMTFTVPELVNATQYEWTLPNGLVSSSGSNITVTNQLSVHASNQSSEGTLSVAGFNACFRGEASQPQTIKIIQRPTRPRPIQGPLEVCPGQTMPTYQVEPVKEATSYEWTLPHGIEPLMGTKLTTSPWISVRIGNDFDEGPLYVQPLNRCGYGSASEVVIIKALPSLATPTISQICNTLKTEETPYPLQWFLNDQPLSNATVAQLAITQRGAYRVRISGPCDTLMAFLTAEPVLGNKDEIPNAFSPNGDNKNESFQLADPLIGSQVKIYNRWGELVFESESYQNDWQGEQQAGIYYYSLLNDCLPKPIQGIITLLR